MIDSILMSDMLFYLSIILWPISIFFFIKSLRRGDYQKPKTKRLYFFIFLIILSIVAFLIDLFLGLGPLHGSDNAALTVLWIIYTLTLPLYVFFIYITNLNRS